MNYRGESLKLCPLVSVIVPTRNSGKTLRDCLRSIKDQTYKNIEIVVVDNFSSDDTESITKELGIKFLRYGNERSSQMNFGVKMTKGEHLLFSYSDLYLEPSLVEDCVKYCRNNEKIDAIIIPIFTKPRDNFWVKCRSIERRITNMGDPLIECPRFYKRSSFEEIGGFDEELIFEDYDITCRMKKAGFNLGKIKTPFLHEDPSSLKDFVRGFYYYGKMAIPNYIKKYPPLSMAQYSFIRPLYFRHLSIFKEDPVHFLGLLFCRFVYYIATLIGILAHFTLKARIRNKDRNLQRQKRY